MTYAEYMTVREFPPFIRVTLEDSARKRLFSHVTEEVKSIKKEYTRSENMFSALYGEKKSTILQLLSEGPQSASRLRAASRLSSSTVYDFLTFLKKQGRVTKKEDLYYLRDDFHTLFLDEIVKLEENPVTRRKYGISVKELGLAYYLWDIFARLAPQRRRYARSYHDLYTLADAVHRWKTGRTDIPVWALNQLIDLAGLDILNEENVIQYHLPPGTPVCPYYNNEYRLPVRMDSDSDKIVIQLLQKMSRNNLYLFPKKKRWLFEKLHEMFGEFHDSTFRIPSAVIEILKSYYRIDNLSRSSACIPPRIKSRLQKLSPLVRVSEEASLLLHILSFSSQSNGGFEITSRSKSFLRDITTFVSNAGLRELSLCRKHGRPHFRVYLSGSKAAVLERYAHLFETYPDLEIWLRIPLNQITEKVILHRANFESTERICYEELSRFVESILRSLERKKPSSEGLDYRGCEEITDYFWERKVIPSPRKIEKLIEMQQEEEALIYV
jgi:hypothetical protein